MNYHIKKSNINRGFAMIVALGIVFIIMALAVIAIRSMRTDAKASYAMRSRLQVSNAATQTATLAVGAVNQNPNLFIEAMKKKGLEVALDTDDIVEGHKARYYNFPLEYFPPYTGLKITNNAAEMQTLRDLSRPFRELASVSRPVVIGKSPGYSDSFCQVRIRIDALARLGDLLPVTAQGYSQYDIDHQSFAENSDVLYLNVGPVPCK